MEAREAMKFPLPKEDLYWAVTPTSPPDPNSAQYLPMNHRRLSWHKAEQVPLCLDGGDLLLALDPKKQVGYMVFDTVCTRHPWTGDFESFARKACLDPWEDA